MIFFFTNFPHIYKNVLRTRQLDIIKKAMKRLKKVSWKVSKSFWRRKNKKRYGRERYKNLSKNKKQKLVVYRKTSFFNFHHF